VARLKLLLYMPDIMDGIQQRQGIVAGELLRKQLKKDNYLSQGGGCLLPAVKGSWIIFHLASLFMSQRQLV